MKRKEGRFANDARVLRGIWGIVHGKPLAVCLLWTTALYGTVLYLIVMFYRELVLLVWRPVWAMLKALGRAIQRGDIRLPKLSKPQFGRAKVINMTGPASGSYDKDGLPW